MYADGFDIQLLDRFNFELFLGFDVFQRFDLQRPILQRACDNNDGACELPSRYNGASGWHVYARRFRFDLCWLVC
jgi:hypothetical protein